MKEYTANIIANIVNGSVTGNSNQSIHHILTDSRKLAFPEDSLFFAIRGERHDGHHYIEALIKKGVICFVVNDIPAKLKEKATFIQVQDTLDALQILTAHHRNQFEHPVVGITGSNGKTIVKEWLFQSLSAEYKIARSPRSYNSQVGVPHSVWQLENEYDLGIIEAGISKPGEMERLQKIIHPEIGIFTNIGEAHQENFQHIQEKINEKLKLFYHSNHLIYCKDHKKIDKAITHSNKLKNINHFTWSYSPHGDLQVIKTFVEKNKTKIVLNYKNQAHQIEIPFTDKVSLENIMHVCSMMVLSGYSFDIIKRRMHSLSPIGMRLEMKKGINNCTIINDSYNSDTGSLSIALDFLEQQHQHPHKTLILSDILQTGKPAETLYKEVALLIKNKQIDRLIGIGKAITEHRDAFSIPGIFYDSTQAFLKEFSRLTFQNEAILLKGARIFKFERISTLLEEKMNRTVLEINLNALQHNLNYFKSLLSSTTKMMVMVKAFSYGSGSYEIAHMLQYQHVDYLGVAFADEGIALRNAGVNLPIMVMNPDSSGFEMMLNHELEPEIFDLQGLYSFNKAIDKMGSETFYPVHVKIDTGMNRLGFYEDQLDELIAVLKQTKNIRVKSVFSHLAASDSPEHDDFTHLQIKRFEKMSDKILASLGYPVDRHILNSSGIERFTHAQYDMVRLGIGIYGISAIDASNVEHISTLKTYIAQIKQVPSTETIGYGRQGKLSRDTTIGVVPIGYADGINRMLSKGKGNFIVNGHFAPIIGNVCMDITMIDITGLDVKPGDEVIVFGKQQPISVLANQLNTIPYEILTSISGRVKRVYYQE
ncbi:MAG: bifunctional UDP-N-acetylmuramoyl-tripeptide:D-alanyl-D-alanine ligase/alanine racemase [Bacteroidota bacterium]